jgi:hypothetical protein
LIGLAEQGLIALYVGVGLGALFVGLGTFILSVRAGALLARVGRTLDEVDKQIGTLSIPIATTLTHVGGIAGTADATIARLGSVVSHLDTSQPAEHEEKDMSDIKDSPLAAPTTSPEAPEDGRR